MKDFDEIYDNICINKGLDLDNLRKMYVRKVVLIVIIAISILFFLLLPIMLSTVSENDIILRLSILLIPFLMISVFIIGKTYNYANHMKDLYKKKYKKDIIEPLIKYCDENLEYEPKNGIPLEEYIKAGFNTYVDYSSEDYIYGNINGIGNFWMSEIFVIGKSFDKDIAYLSIYNGIFTKAEINKKMNDVVRIVKNSTKIYGENKRVELDWEEFEKFYEVYSTNDILAMRILTSDVMKMLVEFQEENNITPEISISENHLYIRFETGRLFENGNPKVSLINYNNLKRYYSIINFTLDIMKKMKENIDDLNL